MDFLHISVIWILKYGSVILFLLLALGIFGFPIPNETLLFMSGWLIAQGKLYAPAVIIAAIAGSICGITVSYWLGSATGPWLIRKYGSKLHITEQKVNRTKRWFQHTGKWSLMIGYFFPLVRHLIGYVAGSTHLRFKQFMLFGYSGAIIWSMTFILLGYILKREVYFLRLH